MAFAFSAPIFITKHRRSPATASGTVNLELSDEISEYCSSHDAWKDFDSGLIVSMVDIVCNKTLSYRTSTASLAGHLTENPLQVRDHGPIHPRAIIIWPFYPGYVPDHFQRVEAAIRFVTEHKYQPVFFHEGLLGGRM